MVPVNLYSRCLEYLVFWSGPLTQQSQLSKAAQQSSRDGKALPFPPTLVGLRQIL
jgi:hypothetical protein